MKQVQLLMIAVLALDLAACSGGGSFQQNPVKGYGALAGARPPGADPTRPQTAASPLFRLSMVDVDSKKNISPMELRMIQGERRRIKISPVLLDDAKAGAFELRGTTTTVDAVHFIKDGDGVIMDLHPRSNYLEGKGSVGDIRGTVELVPVGATAAAIIDNSGGVTTTQDIIVSVYRDSHVPRILSIKPESKDLKFDESATIEVVATVEGGADDGSNLTFEWIQDDRNNPNIFKGAGETSTELDLADGTNGVPLAFQRPAKTVSGKQVTFTTKFDAQTFLAAVAQKKLINPAKKHRDVETGKLIAHLYFQIRNTQGGGASLPGHVTFDVVPSNTPGAPVLGDLTPLNFKSCAEQALPFIVTTYPNIGDVSLPSVTINKTTYAMNEKGEIPLTGLKGEAKITCSAPQDVVKPGQSACVGNCVMSCNLFMNTGLGVTAQTLTIGLNAKSTLGQTTLPKDNKPLALKVTIEKGPATCAVTAPPMPNAPTAAAPATTTAPTATSTPSVRQAFSLDRHDGKEAPAAALAAPATPAPGKTLSSPVKTAFSLDRREPKTPAAGNNTATKLDPKKDAKVTNPGGKNT